VGFLSQTHFFDFKEGWQLLEVVELCAWSNGEITFVVVVAHAHHFIIMNCSSCFQFLKVMKHLLLDVVSRRCTFDLVLGQGCLELLPYACQTFLSVGVTSFLGKLLLEGCIFSSYCLCDTSAEFAKSLRCLGSGMIM
jgi:hypothetical protein